MSISQGVQRKMVLVVNCFVFLNCVFCFDAAIFDIGLDVEAIFHLPLRNCLQHLKIFSEI